MQVKPISMWNFDDDLTGFAAWAGGYTLEKRFETFSIWK